MIVLCIKCKHKIQITYKKYMCLWLKGNLWNANNGMFMCSICKKKIVLSIGYRFLIAGIFILLFLINVVTAGMVINSYKWIGLSILVSFIIAHTCRYWIYKYGKYEDIAE